jgi:alkanesulfonate monooxygenase SsuD/methylene tetrahydromethanopterin reductase-like flavin-dependent oxidoreductase (luciferase family)
MKFGVFYELQLARPWAADGELRLYNDALDQIELADYPVNPIVALVNMWDEYTAWKRANPEATERALSGGLIGSPDTIRRKLRKFEDSNIDQVILLNQAGRNSHADICASLELFAAEVMDEFHANVPPTTHGRPR